MVTCESEQLPPSSQAQTTDMDALLQIDDHFVNEIAHEETKEPNACFQLEMKKIAMSEDSQEPVMQTAPEPMSAIVAPNADQMRVEALNSQIQGMAQQC